MNADKIKGLKFLSGMDIDLKTKKKLQKQAKLWLKYIKLHSKEINHNDNMYHRGEMSFIKLFFFQKTRRKLKS